MRCAGDYVIGKEPKRVRLLIAIPVFNERKYVERVLQRVRQYHDQILMIDDGSTDGTAELLEQRDDIFLIRHPQNRGYGESIIDAFDYAFDHGYDWVITMDCDEQHEPERIPDFVREIRTNRWDIISGSRYLHAEEGSDLPPGDRRMINATITTLVNRLFSWKLTDAFCGFKAHRVCAMKRLHLDQSGYAFPLQLWPRAAQAKLRITEIPVRLIYNDPTRHFGGQLDNPASRLQHYLDVLNAELCAAPQESEAAPAEVSCCGCE
jgi:glycosyltransferase involved in cell wall biosynthesis